ncbi:MAG: hypothetical protein ABWZ40_05070 [Caulobacterales bacterium]
MKNVLIVFSNPLDGRHDDFNDWYTNVHIRDVMRMPSSVGVQRFKLAEEQPVGSAPSPYKYVVLYEIDDTEKCTAAHAGAMTPLLPISDAFDLTSPCNYFRARSNATADPLADATGDVIVVEFDDQKNFNAAAVAAAVGKDGLLSATHLSCLGDQLIDRAPQHPEIAVFRLSKGADAAKAMHLVESSVAQPAKVSHYRALTERVTSANVLAASAAEKAVEDRARAALENKQHRLP